MLTQFRRIIFFISVLTIIINALAGCNKKSDVVPIAGPAAATFTRSLNFPLIPLRRDTTYTEQAVKVKINKVYTFTNTPALLLSLFTYRDTVRFIIPTSTYTPSWADNYGFMSGTCPNCIVQAIHEYSPEYLIDKRRIVAKFSWNSGELTMVNYDAEQKLISANFQYTNENWIDLYDTGTAGNYFQLKVNGSFKNVSIE